MTSTHWLLLAGTLAVLGAMIGTATEWRDVLRPGFVGPAIAQIAIVVKAIYSEKAGA